MGTNEGLNRFDGYQFVQYRFNADDTVKSLTNNWIQKIYEDKSGTLWVATRNGISAINAVTNEIKKFYYKEKLFVWDLLPAENSNKVWAATDKGLLELNIATGSWQTCKTPFANSLWVTSVAQDAQHRLWLGTYRRGVIMYDYLKQTFKQFAVNEIEEHLKSRGAILGPSVIDKDGNLWVTSWYAGLTRINTVTFAITTFVHDNRNPNSAGGNGGADIFEDTIGKIWVAGLKDGYFVYNPSNGKFENYPLNNNPAMAAGSSEASAVYEDKSGVYWVGTERGLNKYDPGNQRIKTVALQLHKNGDNETEIILSAIESIQKENDSLLWLGLRRGLYIINQKSLNANNPFVLGTPYISNVVNTLTKDENGGIWAGGDGCFFRCTYNARTGAFWQQKILLPGTAAAVVCIYCSNNNVWMGTYGAGLFRYNTITGKFAHYLPSANLHSPSPDNIIFSLLPLPNSKLLLGTNNQGLCVFDAITNNFAPVALTEKTTGSKADYSSILSLLRDSRNNIWVTTQFGGLLATNDSLQHFITVAEKDGLPTSRIDYITEDGLHNLWLTGLGRLILYNPRTKGINVFTNSSGLSGTNNIGCVYNIDANTMLFAEDNTLRIFHPKDFIGGKKPPGIYISGFKVFDRDVTISDSLPVTLRYNQNYFSFEYVGINYSHTELTQYQYTLTGLDKSWHDAGRTRTVSYANLAEGTYTFKVRARNGEGIWSATPASLKIIIAPPFWHRWWFYAVVTILAAAIGYLLYRIKVNQLKKEIGIRDKIASDLHDDVGSTLSSIRFFTNVAYDTAKETGGTAVEPMIKRIDEASEKILYSLDDIVWSVNPANDRMELLAARMTEFAAEMLEARDIKLHLCIDPDINNVKLTLAKRHDFFLIYKEAINNLAKYSGADDAHVSLQREKNKMLLIVNDNGKGFDLRTVKRGDGLNNMQKRADKIKAQLSISSIPGKGTTVKLSCTPT